MLVAVCADELPAAQQILDQLSDEAYGQIWIEGSTDDLPLPLIVPPRVTVHHLQHLPQANPGLLAATAMHAWWSEWMPDEPSDDRAFTLWIGGRVRQQLAWIGLAAETI